MCSTFGPVDVQTWLEWAGEKILLMNVGLTKPREYKVAWPDYAPDPQLAFGTNPTDLRLPGPGKDEIPFIDEIIGLVVVIPDPIRRRVVSCRALVHPIRHNPIYGWTKIAALLHTDRRTVRRWHTAGLKEIARLTPCAKMQRIASFLSDAPTEA